MTVSTSDLGGMGNGLGLPIANPLYGPANAAFMAQQAWKQNVANAQAQTEQTQAQTNKINTMLPAELAQTQAQTGQIQQQARATQIENDAKDVLGPQGLATGMKADIMSKQTKSAQEQQDYIQRQIIMNGPQMDAMEAQQPGSSKALLEKWGFEAGLQPGEASTIYGGLAAKNAQQGPNMGPGNAAQGPQGGYGALSKQFLEANPEIMKTRIQEAGATERTGMTTGTEERIATQRINTELQMQGIDKRTNPQTAYEFLRSKEVEAINGGNFDLAKQYHQQSEESYAHYVDSLRQQAAARGMYGINYPGIGLPNNLSAGQIQPPQAPGIATGGGAQAPQGQPQPPAVGQDLGNGAKLVGVPQGQGGGAAPPPPQMAPIQGVSTGPGGPQAQQVNPQVIEQQAQAAASQIPPQARGQAAQALNAKIPQLLQQVQGMPQGPQRDQALMQINVLQRTLEKLLGR